MNMKANKIAGTLQRLSEAIGISGFEDEPRNLILQEIEGLVDKCWVDPIGNLLAIRKGDSKHPRILLDAHMDEIGFLVSHVDNQGFARIAPIGGWDPRILPGHRVVLQVRRDNEFQRIYGVIGAVPPHLTTVKQRENVIPIDDLFIDLGVSSREEAGELGVRVGTPLAVWQPFLEFSDVVCSGKAFDDRAGCTVLIEVLRRLENEKEQSATVVFNFAVAEEVGGRGAKTGAYTLEPDVALAIECTSAGDMPSIPSHQSPTELGKGPAVTVADRSLVAHPRVVETLEQTANERKIPWQLKQPLGGGTDGGLIAVTRSGVPTGVVSVPCRYIHSSISLLRLNDLVSTVDLVQGFTQTWKHRE
jgi:putative aminopeptidase FrvX